jgi:hypothetical protein
MIAAWHKVPGKRRPENEPSRRVRSDSCRCAQRFNDWSEEACEIKSRIFENGENAFRLTRAISCA